LPCHPPRCHCEPPPTTRALRRQAPICRFTADMAPATDSLQKDSYSRYRAKMEKGVGGHGTGGDRDERRKGENRATRFRLPFRGCIPPRLTGILMNFRIPAILPGSRSPPSASLGRVSLSNFEITRPPHAHISIYIEFPAGNSCRIIRRCSARVSWIRNNS